MKRKTTLSATNSIHFLHKEKWIGVCFGLPRAVGALGAAFHSFHFTDAKRIQQIPFHFICFLLSLVVPFHSFHSQTNLNCFLSFDGADRLCSSPLLAGCLRLAAAYNPQQTQLNNSRRKKRLAHALRAKKEKTNWVGWDCGMEWREELCLACPLHKEKKTFLFFNYGVMGYWFGAQALSLLSPSIPPSPNEQTRQTNSNNH